MPAPTEEGKGNPTSGLTPIITDFSPKSARIGEIVTITGKNFGQDASKVSVQFGEAKITSAKTVSDGEITVYVPADASSGQLSLKVASQDLIKSQAQFSLISEQQKQPTLISFSPTSGSNGQEITILGTEFGNDASRVIITMANGDMISPKSVTPTQIVFILPPNSVTGKFSVQVTGFQNLTTTIPFTVINANEKITKTIGVSWMNLSIDANDKLVFAELYGGGNRIVLQQGSGLVMSGNFHAGQIPDIFDPTSMLGRYRTDLPIDNGVPITGVNDAVHTTLTLKGFNKAETGFDELRLVMQKHIYAREKSWGGYDVNYYLMAYSRNGRSSNSAFGSSFLNNVFSGDVKLAALEIAKPKSQGRYIVRDEVVNFVANYYNVKLQRNVDFEAKSQYWKGLFIYGIDDNRDVFVGNKIKAEWVNAERGRLNKIDDKRYELEFDNIKLNGLTQIVIPSDTVDKAFIRLTGFDPDICGYNELRLFLAKSNSWTNQVSFDFSAKPDFVPTFNFVKEAIKNMDGMKNYYLGQSFPHY